MFQYGVLEIDKNDESKVKIVNEPLNGLDTALEQYRWAKEKFPEKNIKLVLIEYKVMEVLSH